MIKIKTQRHHYLISGLLIPNITSNIELAPSILVKYNSKIQVDLTAIAKYKNKYLAGLGYRTSSAAGYLILGLQARENLRLGYSTDFSLTSLKGSGLLTHEIQVNYCFDLQTITSGINVRNGNETLNSD